MQLDSIIEVEECLETSEEKIHGDSINKSAFLKHKEAVNLKQARKEIELAQEEWDQVSFTAPFTGEENAQTECITFEEVVEYFHNKDMRQYLKCIKPTKQRRGFEAFKHWIVGPPKLNENLISDRDLFFGIALCPFDSTDKIHLRVLQTLYKTLSATERDCPRYGRHWEDIGFQGSDPGTDLRGVGFLGLLHLMSLAQNPLSKDLAIEISLLSKHEKQNFPFCTMGINITRIVLEAMREEVLNRECNRKRNVFNVTSDFYTGVFLQLFLIWKQEKKTIMDSGYVIKDLTAQAKKHSCVILRELHNYLQTK